MTLSNGGLTATQSGRIGGWHTIRNTISKTTGKVYVEFLNSNVTAEKKREHYLWICGRRGLSLLISVQLGRSNSSYSVGVFYKRLAEIQLAGFTANYSI